MLKIVSRRTGFRYEILCCGLFLSLACAGFVATASSAQDSVEFNEAELPIAFYAPTEGDYPAFRSSSFSVPRPIVVIEPVVNGTALDNPYNSTFEQVGPDRLRVRIKGLVFDFLADMVAGHHADIREVELVRVMDGTRTTLSLENVGDSMQHPFFDTATAHIESALRPYPFAGRFDTGEFELQIGSGSNQFNITATDLNGGAATASLTIRGTVNRETGQYDVEVEPGDSLDIGLYVPILVHINDDSITPDNVDQAYAEVNFRRVGLRFIDGQLQLDRPIIGLNRTPPAYVPNLVDVVGNPDRFHIRYREHEAIFGFSFTR